jgi:hypothetical protein
VIIALALCAAPMAFASTEYLSQSAFDAAVPGATTYGFDSYAPSMSQTFYPIVSEGGVSFSGASGQLFVAWGINNGYYGGSSFISGQDTAGVNSQINVTAAGGVTAIGFDIGSYTVGASLPVTITLSTGEVFNLLTPADAGVSTEFVGFTSGTPITSINIAENGHTIDITNFEVASPVPLPASVWLMLSGLVGVGAVARKRRDGEPWPNARSQSWTS